MRIRREANSVRGPVMSARFKTAALPNEKCESIGWHLCTLCSGWLSIVLGMRLGEPIGKRIRIGFSHFFRWYKIYAPVPLVGKAMFRKKSTI